MGPRKYIKKASTEAKKKKSSGGVEKKAVVSKQTKSGDKGEGGNGEGNDGSLKLDKLSKPELLNMAKDLIVKVAKLEEKLAHYLPMLQEVNGARDNLETAADDLRKVVKRLGHEEKDTKKVIDQINRAASEIDTATMFLKIPYLKEDIPAKLVADDEDEDEEADEEEMDEEADEEEMDEEADEVD